MTIYLQIVALAITILSVIVLPLLFFTIRTATRWSRIEDRLIRLTEDMKEVQENHDRRLTWLEQNLWRRGR